MSPSKISNGDSSPEASLMPIAVIGMSCRFPGSATSPDGFWQMLSRGQSGWSRGNNSRFNMDAFYHPAKEIRGAFNARGLYLLKQDIGHFDNQFFNVSPLEAKSIDPQQRLLLESAYEAFENAGIPIAQLSLTETGVYCAVCNHDYEKILGRDPELSPNHRYTGTGGALVSNRISYHFNLNGPSMTLDTACSGSLVAVHEACKALRSGEICQALVGGTNLILDPEHMGVMSSLQFLSDHGRCYSFDSRADGLGRGEGVAAIVLKPLSDAIRDGDPIQSIIRGSAVNQDGLTPSVTMPSAEAQVKMINKAYRDAGLDPRDTCYVEAHGTGTQVGDKIESTALANTFCHNRAADSPLYVGSVKTNIGHTECVSGLAGVIKTVLALQNGTIPPNLNFSRSNEQIPLDKWNIIVPRRTLPWPKSDIQRASVNNFGYGGTNAHVILEAPNSYYLSRRSTANGTTGNRVGFNGNGYEKTQQLFVLTHANERGMSAMASDLKTYLQSASPEKNLNLENLAYTLSNRRSHLGFRAAVGATNLEELLEALESISKGTIRPRRAIEKPKICFVFTGQGAQWAQMGRELLHSYPVFAKSMAMADRYFTKLGADWSLLTELSKPSNESRINEAMISQPSCTAIQVALVNLLRSWAIFPEVVCGHSSGEIAAAYSAGYLHALDALGIAFFRGKSVKTLKKQHPKLEGRMLAAGLSPDEALDYISRNASSTGKVVIACHNSPSSVTLSGDKSALQKLQQHLERDGIFNRLLAVDVAYHSHHMALVRKEYVEAISGIKPLTSDGQVRMISSVTGVEVEGNSLDAEYWAQNMISPVRFSEAFEGTLTISSEGKQNSRPMVDIILEIGPHAALAGPIKQIIKARNLDLSKLPYYSVLTRKVDAAITAVNVAGELFTHGLNIAFDSINDPNNNAEKKVLTSLPVYNWQHTMSHWSESRLSSQYRLRKFPRHDLLGIPSNDSIQAEPTWRNYVSMAELPWLSGHAINGQTLFPASGFISMALEALHQITESANLIWKDITCQFREIIVGRALLIPENDGVETFFTLRQYSYSTQETSTWKEFRVYSMSPTGDSFEHCRGLVFLEHSGPARDTEKSQEIAFQADVDRYNFNVERKARGPSMDVEEFYTNLQKKGLKYTGPFASVTEIYANPKSAMCSITIPDTKKYMPAEYQQPHVVHPATLDALLQTAFPVLMKSGQMTSSFVVSGIDELSISSDISSKPGTELLTLTTVQSFGRLKNKAYITVGDPELTETSLIRVKGLALYSTDEMSSSSHETENTNLFNKIEWSLDVTCAKPEDIEKGCKSGLPQDTDASLRAETFDKYIYVVIQELLSEISPKVELDMAPHHRKLVHWMRMQSRRAPVNITPDKGLKERVKAFGIEGVMLAQVSDNLLKILKGQIDPLSVLMKDDVLYKFYSMVNIERCHIQMVNYLRQLKFKNPRMRILEIGAGTGSTSMAALDALVSASTPRRGGSEGLEKYVFTDISAGFFDKAKAKLDHWDGLVEFKKLNAEVPVKEQGFTEGSFDLIIASNVLHATPVMSSTMKNVRSLLKPGGKLALVEITEIHMLWHMTVGTLPGWWLGAEDGRPDSPLLRLPQWNHLLQNTGFSGTEIVMKDYDSPTEHQVSLIISSALPQTIAHDMHPIQVICGKAEMPIADALSREIISAEPSRHVTLSNLSQVNATGKICVVLLEFLKPLLTTCDKEEFQKLKDILLEAKGVLWVTKGAAIESSDPQKALITGLARTLRSEDHATVVVTLDLEANIITTTEAAKHIQKVLDHAFRHESADGYLQEFEYAVRNGNVLIPRVTRNSSLETYVRSTMVDIIETQHLRQPYRALDLEIQTPGLLESLHWSNSKEHSREPTTDEVRIEIGYIALNFKDFMNAMGKLAGLSAMLIECSGIVVQVGNNARNKFSIGDRVCAIRPLGLATTSNVDYHMVQRVPDGMSSELAAAVLISYATALYSLRDVARFKKGESVLIHAAAGALGQASIALAQYLGAGLIFATVGSAEKKSLLIEKFGIPEENIFSSRTLSFGQGIQRRTNGRGVDVVLNSLSADAARESQKCLAQFGRFVELGKKDLLSNARMETQYLEKNGLFAAVDLGMVAEQKPSDIQEILSTVIHLIHTKKVAPISPITVKPVSEIEDAFRQMQTGKHMGKILLKIEDQSEARVQLQAPLTPKLCGDSTYLVAGGLGGIGRSVMKYLAQLGAKHIATLSRSGADTSDNKDIVNEMLEIGVNLTIHQGSVAETEDILKVQKAAGKRLIRGIVQGAMVLQDSSWGNMTHSQWMTTLGPKVTGTINLQNVLGESLDFFVLLSSQCGIVGTYGQANYSASSTFQDAFARHLASRGLPIRTIDLGVVGSSGYTVQNESAAVHVIRHGVARIEQQELFLLLNHAISNPISKTIEESQVITAMKLADPSCGGEESVMQRPDPKFSHIWATNTIHTAKKLQTGDIDVSAVLLTAKTRQLAIETVQMALMDILSRLLGFATDDINVDQSVSSYGMDSLIAVELRNWVSKQLESHVQTFELMSAMSIKSLASMITERSRLVPADLFKSDK